jgi:hypothetical protein
MFIVYVIRCQEAPRHSDLSLQRAIQNNKYSDIDTVY